MFLHVATLAALSVVTFSDFVKAGGLDGDKYAVVSLTALAKAEASEDAAAATSSRVVAILGVSIQPHQAVEMIVIAGDNINTAAQVLFAKRASEGLRTIVPQEGPQEEVAVTVDEAGDFAYASAYAGPGNKQQLFLSSVLDQMHMQRADAAKIAKAMDPLGYQQRRERALLSRGMCPLGQAYKWDPRVRYSQAVIEAVKTL